MKLAHFLFCASAAVNGAIWSQSQAQQPPSQTELAEISARGLALAGYDAAAWHASDAVSALHPPEGSVRLYIARKTDKGWVVAFGRFDDSKIKFLIAYEAQQIGNSQQYSVKEHSPPLEDSDYYFHAATARAVGVSEFFQEAKRQRQYNVSVLPAPSGEWYFYAIPAQTDLSVLPYGGDVRYTISNDGKTILEKRQMHKTVLEESIGGEHLFGFHTHILSDVPEDSDAFYALSGKGTNGDFIATRKYFYQARADGTLAYIGTTSDVAKLIQEDKFRAVPASVGSMLIPSLQRLLANQELGNPLEALVSLTGARCADHAIWLKFSQTLHNIGEKRIILYKEPLTNSQARFGASPEEIKSGKYQKLAFFTPSQPDFSSKDSFIALGPGMAYSRESDYPILDLDLGDKGAVQFLFFTWPLGAEKDVDAQRRRWADAGNLYTDTIATAPQELILDPQLIKSCPAK